MLELLFDPSKSPLRVLCLGAHCDDIEIGCGATIQFLGAAKSALDLHCVIFSSDDRRARETKTAMEMLVGNYGECLLEFHSFRDGFFPAERAELKEYFESLKSVAPDLVLTHQLEERHQDHRLVAELTWNTFRNHLILEYEIPKYDGLLAQPNVFVPLARAHRKRKTKALLSVFASQRDKRWFTEETFDALMRLRGIESAAPEGYAEAFVGRKLTLNVTT